MCSQVEVGKCVTSREQQGQERNQGGQCVRGRAGNLGTSRGGERGQFGVAGKQPAPLPGHLCHWSI